MFKVTIYNCEGTIENPTILGIHRDLGKFDEQATALFVMNQEIKLSTKNGADIQIADTDAYWLDGSNRIEYVMKIEEA